MEKVSKNLLKAIDKKDVVSFDIFDTLIKRNCFFPHNIFEIVEKIYNSNEKQTITNFKINRINAEKIAREKSSKEDIDLDEIYNNFNEYDKTTLNKLKQIEIETELKFCVKNESMYEVYNYCKKNNKRIICISDMYLSKDIINEILIKNGYEIDEVYISSEIGKLKRTGNLFKYVLDENKINNKKMIHIGDSKKSDFLIPKFLGIKTILIPRMVKKTIFIEIKKNNNLDVNILNSVINNGVNNKMNQYNRIGYEILGPLCFAFCNWIQKNVKKDKIEKLFFCARDMKFVQEMYNYIYKEDAVDNEYLYVSRKSSILPFLYKNNDFESFCSILTDKKMKIVTILKSVGIYSDEIEKYIEQSGLSISEEYNKSMIEKNNRFRKLYEEKIHKIIEKNGKEQFENFSKYLDKINFKTNIAIADLGWKGTIQYCLMNTFKNKKIIGYYLGLEKKSYKEITNNMGDAYLFNQDSNSDYEKKIYSFRTLLEIFFAAFHGTTLGYSKEESGFYQLGKSENANEKTIIDIQEGAKKFIYDFKKYSIDLSLVDIDEIVRNLMKIGTNPTLNQANIFGNLNYSNMVDGKLAQPQKIYKYILNPKKLKKDIFNSEWKVGFLKRLFIINVPYYKIYDFLKNWRKEND